MIKYLFVLFVFFTLLLPSIDAASDEQEVLTLRIPHPVLVDILSKTVPIQLDPSSDSFSGSIAIQRIENLAFGKQSLSALLGLVGKDMKLSTTIAGHKLLLNIGNVLLDFTVNAKIRYDAAEQTLFITPTVKDIDSYGDEKTGEIGNLLTNLFNGKEFPVAIDKLQPIITDTGSKQLTINMDITDITIAEDALFLHLQPIVQAKPNSSS